MNTSDLLAFVRFHAFANDRILTMAAELTDDELRRPAPLDHGTAFDTLRHLLDVDWSWREYCEGRDVGETYVWEHGYDLDDVVQMHLFCTEEDARLRAFVASLDRDAIDESLALDEEFSVPRWLLLVHIVNHGTTHRSELARYLTDLGHSPGDLDLMDAMILP